MTRRLRTLILIGTLLSFLGLSERAVAQTDSVKVGLEELKLFRIDQLKLDRCEELKKQEQGRNFVLKDQLQLEKQKFAISEAERSRLAKEFNSLSIKHEKVKKRRWYYVGAGVLVGILGGVAVAK